MTDIQTTHTHTHVRTQPAPMKTQNVPKAAHLLPPPSSGRFIMIYTSSTCLHTKISLALDSTLPQIGTPFRTLTREGHDEGARMGGWREVTAMENDLPILFHDFSDLLLACCWRKASNKKTIFLSRGRLRRRSRYGSGHRHHCSPRHRTHHAHCPDASFWRVRKLDN